jgi:2-isopropylmalate synthase
MTQQPESDRVIIFDTTLRDGEQSPGATLNAEEKLRIARQLALLGVDIIEAGFPYSSPGDFAAVQQVAELVGTPSGPIICGLARASQKDIKAAADALKPAAKHRIHTFIATSDIHLEYKLKKTRAEVLEIAGEMVAYAKSFVEDVEFSPEDACRSEPEFLYTVLERAIAAGATTVNIPDTVGYTTPAEFGALIKGIKDNVPNINRAIISVHGHDDLGLAVGNFLEAVKNGARQLECTINGIGERAGNASLEELVMALHVRRQYFNPFLGRPVESTTPLTQIDISQIYKTSRLVSSLTGMVVQPNKAIVGANAFAHESGIHQDGVLKNKLTYEIMDARSIGLTDNRITLGKLSGRNAFRTQLVELGIDLSEDEFNKAFVQFKIVADKKKQITDRDLEAIANQAVRQVPKKFELERFQISSGSGHMQPTAMVELRQSDGAIVSALSAGHGPIDAAYQAIERVTGIEDSQLTTFEIKSIGEGIDAQGETRIGLKYQNFVVSGTGLDTDIVHSAILAYIDAINRALDKADTVVAALRS